VACTAYYPCEWSVRYGYDENCVTCSFCQKGKHERSQREGEERREMREGKRAANVVVHNVFAFHLLTGVKIKARNPSS
jgi:hypothetical protein